MRKQKLIYDTRQLPVLLDSKTVAFLCDVSPDYITKLCRRGELKSKKVGKGWRILKTDALEYIGAKAQTET